MSFLSVSSIYDISPLSKPVNICLISSSLNPPNALSRVVAGNFLFLSIFTFKTPEASVSNSNHEPRLGIILAAKHLFPFVIFNGKNTPGERVN